MQNTNNFSVVKRTVTREQYEQFLMLRAAAVRALGLDPRVVVENGIERDGSDALRVTVANVKDDSLDLDLSEGIVRWSYYVIVED